MIEFKNDDTEISPEEWQKAIEELYKRNAELAALYKKLDQLNKELGEANQKLKSLDHLKTEFLSLASHQLRSPLTAIKGYTSMILEEAYGKVNSEQEIAVKRIYVSAEGLSNLVEDLLNISKIEQGGLQFVFSKVDLVPIVVGLYDELKITAEDRGLEFTVTISAGEKFIADVDATKIKQAFLNLADNSIKYTPHGHVHLSLYRKENSIVFEVKDSGVGISSETKARLFEKFSRGEGGKLNTGGSGLGLYLAKHIAEAHKGDVIAESDGPGKGSVFRVFIPAANS